MMDAINRTTEVKSAGAFEDLASFSRQRSALTQGRTAAAGFRAQGTSALIGGLSSAAGSLSSLSSTGGNTGTTSISASRNTSPAFNFNPDGST